MGYWSKYFSTLFKGARMISFKQRWNSRKIVNNLRKADKLLFNDLPKDVEVDHRVTRAIEHERRTLYNLNSAANGAYALIFESEIQEDSLIKSVKMVSKAISQLKVADPTLKNEEAHLVRGMVDALRKADDVDRKQYKDLLAIIKESEAGSVALRQTVRLRFQKIESEGTSIAALLEKYAARSEARVTARAIVVLNSTASRITALRGVSEKDITRHLPVLLKTAELHVKRAFFDLFALKKRALLWMMKILYDLYSLEEKGELWKEKSYMPQSAIQDGLKEIRKIEGHILEDCKILAQGYMNIINHLESAEKELPKT